MPTIACWKIPVDNCLDLDQCTFLNKSTQPNVKKHFSSSNSYSIEEERKALFTRAQRYSDVYLFGCVGGECLAKSMSMWNIDAVFRYHRNSKRHVRARIVDCSCPCPSDFEIGVEDSVIPTMAMGEDLSRATFPMIHPSLASISIFSNSSPSEGRCNSNSFDILVKHKVHRSSEGDCDAEMLLLEKHHELLVDDDIEVVSGESFSELTLEMWRLCLESGDIYGKNSVGRCMSSSLLNWYANDSVMQHYDDGGGISYWFRLTKYSRLLRSFMQRISHITVPALNVVYDKDVKVSVSRSEHPNGLLVPGLTDEVFSPWFERIAPYLTGLTFARHVSQIIEQVAYHSHGTGIVIGEQSEITEYCNYWPAVFQSLGVLHLMPSIFVPLGPTRLPKKMEASDLILGDFIGNGACNNGMKGSCYKEPLRYYLLSENVLGSAFIVQASAMQSIYNSKLADALGNLFHRVAVLTEKISHGYVPEIELSSLVIRGKVPFNILKFRAIMEYYMCNFQIKNYCYELIRVVRASNTYLALNAPWLIKDDDKLRLQVVKISLEACFVICMYFEPICPLAARSCSEAMFNSFRLSYADLDDNYNSLPTGLHVRKSAPLFPKVVKQRNRRPGVEHKCRNSRWRIAHGHGLGTSHNKGLNINSFCSDTVKPEQNIEPIFPSLWY